METKIFKTFSILHIKVVKMIRFHHLVLKLYLYSVILFKTFVPYKIGWGMTFVHTLFKTFCVNLKTSIKKKSANIIKI